MNQSRVYNKLPLAKEGLPFVLIGCGLTLLLAYTGLFPVSVLAGIMTLFTIYFFRDPKRSPSLDKGAVLTPADGNILEVRELQDGNNAFGGATVKISIFMSVFNVHVNRIPIGGTIEKITYHRGKFFSADLDKASKHNENNRITVRTADSRKVVFIQIAGLIARRIACWVSEGDRVISGQRFGLIRFGSRLEVYLPRGSIIAVGTGQKVKAGETIIGYLP